MTIIQIVTNRVWGGGERYALDLAEEAQFHGHKVIVVCRKGCKEVIEPFETAGLKVVTLPLGFWGRMTARRQLKHIIKPLGDVVVHAHNFKDAALMAGLPRIRLVVTRHLARPSKARHTRLCRHIDALIFPSQRARDKFLSGKAVVDEGKFHVIPNALRQEVIVAEMPPTPPLRLLYAGRLHPEKGLEVLIEAVRELGNKVMLHICGTGESDYISKLKRISQGLNVTFHGHVAAIAPMLAQCHAVVAPSIAPEAFGLNILEAFAAGRPVIASNNGAQPEIISDGLNGFLIPPGDPQAIVEAVKALRPQAMGQAARRAFEERFCFTTFYQRIENLYHHKG